MRNRLIGIALLAGVLTLAGLGAATAPDKPPSADETKKREEALKKAQVDGKYRMLLQQIKVEGDAKTYGDFKDLGSRKQPEYANYKDLPDGHWVYVAPYWYIWRDVTSVQRPRRDWGPEQATGEPDTNMAGDIVTAWASASQDNQDEWLMMEYAEAVVPTAVLVYETYNPGALVRVTAFKLDGEEVELWKGVDPTATDAGIGVSEIPVKINFPVARVKLFFDSRNVPGWNEIDAVGLRDKNKKMHWATAAHASTTYAPPFDAVPPPATPVPGEARLRQLELEVLGLKNSVRELKDSLDELKKMLKDKNK